MLHPALVALIATPFLFPPGAVPWAAAGEPTPVPGSGEGEGGDGGEDDGKDRKEDPDDDGEDRRPTFSTEVLVVGRRPEALQGVPGSAAVVTEEEIVAARPADAGEILRRIPGLVVRSEEGAGLRLNIGFRGLDPTRSRRVMVLEDGVPVAINPYGEPDLYYSPPIERVKGMEVVKGSGSILFGPQTIGGVVNLLTAELPERFGGSAELVVGQRDTFKLLGRVGGGGKEGAPRYSLQVFHKRSDGFRDIGYQVTDVFGKLRFDTSDRGRAQLKVGVYHEDSNSTYVGLTRSMYEQDPYRPTLAPDDEFRVRRYDASLVHDLYLGRGTLLRTLVYGYETARVWRRQLYDRSPVDGAEYVRIEGDTSVPEGALYFRDQSKINDRTYRVFGVEPRFQSVFSTGPLDHTLDYGGRFLVETARRKRFETDFVDAVSGELYEDESQRALAFAAHVQDEVSIRDRVRITPGVRVEHVRSLREFTRVREDGVVLDVTGRAGSSDVTAVVPGIGAVAGTERAHVYAGVHLGFAPPRITTAISSDGVDQQLDAERSVNYELGARVSPWPSVRVEATGFVLDFQNEIIAASDAGGVTAELINGGRTLHVGVESAATFALGEALRLPLRLDLSGQYTFARATFATGEYQGNLLPYAPLHTASARLDLDVPFGLGAQVSLTHVGAQFADGANTLDASASGLVGRLDPYQVLDASLRYTVRRIGLTLDVTGKGLLDRVHIASRLPDGIQPAGYRQLTGGITWERW